MNIYDYLKSKFSPEQPQDSLIPGATMPPAAPIAPQTPVSGYDDGARNQLYDYLAKRSQKSLIGAGIAGLGDTIANAYGKGGQNMMRPALESIEDARKTDVGEFEAGRTAMRQKQSDDLTMKDATRKETEYKDENDPMSPMSKAAVSLALKMKMPGVSEGKSSYADINKLMPIQEKLLAAEMAAQSKKDATDTKAEQKTDKYVQKHAENIAKSGLPETINSFNELADQFSSGKDVAGIGLLDSMVPGMMLSGQGARNRTNLQQLSNSILKQRSGAAVSDQEYRRFLLELQAGKMPTEKTLKAHLGKLQGDLKLVMGQYESAMPSEALKEYQTRPGAIQSTDIRSMEQPAVGLDDAKAKRLAELRTKRDAGTLR